MKSFKLIIALLLVSGSAVAQLKPTHVEPPFWWIGMKNTELQLMLHGTNISELQPEFSYPGVALKEVVKLDNPNYLVLNLNITSTAKAGSFKVNLKDGKKVKFAFDYELKPRATNTNRNLGFNSSDVIYLLMPDRFANGDPTNDNVKGMLETVNRSNPNGRHGGDLKGLSDRLDYIKSLGMTAVWLTPTFENDMTPQYGAYHGYAATDLYAMDRRFGSNEEFNALVQKCHDMGLKVIMDMIHNHVGDQHWWMKDLPSKDWVHDVNKYGMTNYRGAVQSDPYASNHDMDRLVKGWFVPSMPDLDQRNPILATYLIQNSIWWVEYSGVDGIRMDTYVYPYKEYLARWVKEVIDAYPNFNIVGEAWVEEVAHEAYWQMDAPKTDGHNTNLPSLTDFQIMFALDPGLHENMGWREGLSRLYYAVSQDRLYADAMKNVIFLDNHDTERFFTRMGQNADLFKMGYGFIMTTRGIPQVYYGTELMWPNDEVQGDGRKRKDMPGGWAEDTRSVFTREGRTPQEQAAFEYVQKLTNWRKTATAIHSGKLVHFIPENNTYVYFRYTENEAVMVVMNKNTSSTKMNRNRFKEILDGYKTGVHVIDGSTIDVSADFEVGPMQTAIYDLKK